MAVLEATTSVADLSTDGERQVRLETTSHVWNVSAGTPDEILISANGSGLAVDDRIIMDLDIFYEELTAQECTDNATTLGGTGTYDAATSGCVVTDCFTQTSPDNSSIATPQDISTEVLATAKIYRVDARAKTQDSPVITDTIIVSRIVEGSGAYSGSFSNGAHSIPNDKDDVLNFTGSSTTFTGYYGTEKLAYTTDADPSEGFFNVTNLAHSSGISGPAVVSDTEGVLFGNITAWTAGTGTAGSRTFDVKARGTGSPESTTFVGLQQTLTKVSDGAEGAGGSAWTSGASVPSSGTGNDGDFFLETTNEKMYEKVSGGWVEKIADLKGTDGADPDVQNWIFQDKATNPGKPSDSGGIPSGWSDTSPASTTDLLWSTVGTQTAGTGDFVWGEPVQMSGEDGTNGTNGTNGSNGSNGSDGPAGDRGAGTYSGTTTLTSDPGNNLSTSSSFGVSAQAALTAAGAGSPENGDIITLVNTTPTPDFVVSRFFNSTTWDTFTEIIDGNLIVQGTIAVDKLLGNATVGSSFSIGDGYGSGITFGGSLYSVESTGLFTNLTSGDGTAGGAGTNDKTAGVWGRVTGDHSYGVLGTVANSQSNSCGGVFGHWDGSSSYKNIVLLSSATTALVAGGNVEIGDVSTSYTLTLNGNAITSGGGGGGTTETMDNIAQATVSRTIGGAGVTLTSGDFNASSDRRLKSSIEPLEAHAVMSALKEITPVTYTMKSSNEPSLGFIAQDVEEYFPDLVSTGEEDMKALNYAKMTAILWKQNQELLKRIEKLEGEE